MRPNKEELEKRVLYRLLKVVTPFLFFALLFGWDFIDDELLGEIGSIDSETTLGVIVVTLVTILLSAMTSFFFWKLSVYIFYGKRGIENNENGE